MRGRPLAAGFELTFTNDALIEAGKRRGDIESDTEENLAARDAFAAAVRAAVGEHEHRVELDRYGFPRDVITYPDGYWIKIAIDPWVVEATGRHQTIAEYRAIQDRFDAHVFRVAESIGLTPHERIGGGHIHLDRDSIGSEQLILRNFFVDFCNHPELAMGILGFDPLNGPALATAPAAIHDELARLLGLLDGGAMELGEFLAALRASVYVTASPELPDEANRCKYQALSVNHPETFELRPIRPQRSFAEYLLLLELFEGRIGYLRRLRDPIPFRPQSWPAGEKMPVAPAVAAFHTYVTEAGLSWSRFRGLLVDDYARHDLALAAG